MVLWHSHAVPSAMVAPPAAANGLFPPKAYLAPSQTLSKLWEPTPGVSSLVGNAATTQM